MNNPIRATLIALAIAVVGVAVIACGSPESIDSPAFVRESVADLAPNTTTTLPTVEPRAAGSVVDEQLFIATLDAGDINYGVTDSGIDMGYAVCDYLATGATLIDAATLIASEGFYSNYEAGYIVGAATETLCPEWS